MVREATGVIVRFITIRLHLCIFMQIIIQHIVIPVIIAGIISILSVKN